MLGRPVVGRNAAVAIRVEGLQKSFGDEPVLWDLDLEVQWGEFLVLLGANGTGKTTLLRLMSTQARPEAGQILVAGYDQKRQPRAIRRNIGVVGHLSYLYEDLTCRENLEFYGRLYQVKELSRQLEMVLDRVGLTQRAHQRVRTLSHGLRQRLALARAILHEPSILLLDEPEGGLDRQSIGMLRQLTAEWTAAGGSIVMTTHNEELGRSWAHRVGVLSQGKVHFPKESLGWQEAGRHGTAAADGISAQQPLAAAVSQTVP
ncbi:MAG: heme ABC exporter ATP-binding protein CcmA [Stenotrophomonas maltophilia]